MVELPSVAQLQEAVTPSRQLALTHLLEAYDAAAETGRDPQAYACQLDQLLAQGIHDTTLRWLLDQGLAQHLRETTKPAHRRRRFRPAPNARFTTVSCFALTPAGLGLARQAASGLADQVLRDPHTTTTQGETTRPGPFPLSPRWDVSRRTLFFGLHIVKQFKQPSQVQQLILTAFEEEHWPPRIDDPLPPAQEIDPKKRLSDAVFRLNKHQKNHLLVFEADGTGSGVQWRERDGGVQSLGKAAAV